MLSVRAMMTILTPVASPAALIALSLASHCWRVTRTLFRFCLPRFTMWPQVRLEGSWFSRWTPPAPTRISSVARVKAWLGPPKPASMFTNAGGASSLS
jgi:hypothetical protein